MPDGNKRYANLRTAAMADLLNDFCEGVVIPFEDGTRFIVGAGFVMPGEDVARPSSDPKVSSWLREAYWKDNPTERARSTGER